jgi:general stress protein 26
MVAHSGDQGDSRAARRLNEPAAVLVLAEDEIPTAVNRVGVATVREEWHVVDRWWTEEPVRRRYFEVVLETGRNVVVFRDELSGKWYRQQA